MKLKAHPGWFTRIGFAFGCVEEMKLGNACATIKKMRGVYHVYGFDYRGEHFAAAFKSIGKARLYAKDVIRNAGVYAMLMKVDTEGSGSAR